MFFIVLGTLVVHFNEVSFVRRSDQPTRNYLLLDDRTLTG
jgi:hypothetical protein